MNQIDHLDAAVVVHLSFEDAAPCRSHVFNRREVLHVVVNFLQLARLEIGKDLLHAAFGFAQKHRVGVLGAFLSVQHDGDAPADDGNPPGAKRIRDFPAALHLRGQHHRDADKIGIRAEVHRLDIFIDKRHLRVGRQSGCHHHRPVRRKNEPRLAVQLFPFRIDQQKFHAFPFIIHIG